MAVSTTTQPGQPTQPTQPAQQGFKEQEQAPSSSRVADWDARCIPLDELSYEKTSIRDVPEGEMPELPIGIFVRTTGTASEEENGEAPDSSWERLRSFTVHADIGTGRFVKALGRLESKGMQNAKNIINAISRFLAVGHENVPPALVTIGGEPLATVARRANLSPQRLIEDMYLADVATMMLGVRLATRGREYAATMNCPMRNCNEVCKEMCSMDELNIKSIVGLRNKPVFRVTLENGINDGKTLIKKVYMSPVKFHQLDVFFKRNLQPSQMLEEVIVGLPESEIYGLKSGKPFCDDLFDRLERTGEDQKSLVQALQKIKPGPDAEFNITCECGDNQLKYPLPWSVQPQEFLYFSNMHPDSSDD